MINEARTFLLNRSGAGRSALGFRGEEYIEPGFRPVTESASTASLRNTLFGPDPCGLTQNYRLAQYMTMIHCCDWTDLYARSLDSRLTYRNSSGLFGDSYGAVVSVNGANVSDASSVSGGIDATMGVNSFSAAVVMTYISGPSASITVTPDRVDLFPILTPTVAVVTTASSWRSGPITAASTLTLRFGQDGVGIVPGSYSGVVSFTRRPLFSLPEIMGRIDSSSVAACCAGNPSDGQTLLNLYRSSKRETDRLAAAMCAVVSETRRIRNA